MAQLTEGQLARIGFVADPTNFKKSANLKATNYGKTVPNPDLMPTQEKAIEWLRNLITDAKVITAQFGECWLTGESVRGQEIYFRTLDGMKLAISKEFVDSLI